MGIRRYNNEQSDKLFKSDQLLSAKTLTKTPERSRIKQETLSPVRSEESAYITSSGKDAEIDDILSQINALTDVDDLAGTNRKRDLKIKELSCKVQNLERKNIQMADQIRTLVDTLTTNVELNSNRIKKLKKKCKKYDEVLLL